MTPISKLTKQVKVSSCLAFSSSGLNLNMYTVLSWECCTHITVHGTTPDVAVLRLASQGLDRVTNQGILRAAAAFLAAANQLGDW